ncbi:HesB/IscA family protein [Sulfoacidibacillus ferrooxidans]|uniref:Iron-sulfur cluster insertion protein ErpA n=1 Tax=Sulfoacidibacillus ferrooxidans TaxID=2005001 RepID=A0A9X2AD34_9BACL|nr:iron-sulfur cluster assembly accessory protein [Sulfoacidibacillus ferrooxidans]MCI0182980.1 Iron-sulfur cluster insertion protein ErpA [Sulfoacidibacillus ferrooxidans]
MVTLTMEAASVVKDLLSDKEEDMGLRIFVKPGGCSGFSYGMALDMKKESDLLLLQEGVPLLVDEASLPFIDGSEIDYVDGLSGKGFKIVNPNAVSSCGCGSSFHTKDNQGTPGSCS